MGVQTASWHRPPHRPGVLREGRCAGRDGPTLQVPKAAVGPGGCLQSDDRPGRERSCWADLFSLRDLPDCADGLPGRRLGIRMFDAYWSEISIM